MKKIGFFCLFALSLLGLASSAANATETTQVGSINGWSQSVVMSLTNSHFEIIYPSDLLSGLNGACQIEEIAFPYVQSEMGASHTGGHTGKVKIYLANTTDAEVGTAFTDVSSMTLVYDGETTWEGGSEEEPSWAEYALPTSFNYTGRNLRLVFVKEASLYSNVQFGAQTGLNIPYLMQDAFSSDVVNDLKRGSNVIPVTKFGHSEQTTGAALTSNVYNWKQGKATIGQTYTCNVTIKGSRLTGNVNIGASTNGIVTADKSSITKEEAEAGATVVLTLAPQDDQTSEDHLTISSEGADDIVLNITWEPKWARPGTSVTIGDPNSAASSFRVPARLNSKYSKSELIYTAEELGIGNSSISKIAFPYAKDKWSKSAPEIGAKVKIYLQNTEDTSVGDAITDVATMTKVYEDSVTYVGTGTPTDPIWLEFEFTEPFNYTGGSLRVVYENENSEEKTNSYYFRDDYYKHKKALLSYGTSASKLEYSNQSGQAFPVIRVYSESTIKVDPAKFEASEVALYTTATQTFNLTVVGDLNNGIKISAPTTQYVKVSTTAITNEELAANNNTASFTVTISPEETSTTNDKIVVSSRGLDDIVIPITWTPVLGYAADVHTIGETNDVTQKVPLFATWEASESEMVYKAEDLHLKKGSKIRRIELPMTFNSNSLVEELTVSLANTSDTEVGESFTDGMTQVAKVTKTIPACGQIEATTPAYWMTFDIQDAFVYDGSNLRFRLKGVSESYSEEWYFSTDSKRKGELPVLLRFAGSEAELEKCTMEAQTMVRTKVAYPVIRITVVDESTGAESTFDLSSYSWVNGESEQGKEYTKVVTVSAKNLQGDITISTPTDAAVTVAPTTISKADAEAGTATFTVTLKPENLTTNKAGFIVSSTGAESIEFPVYWTPIAADPLKSVQAGKISGWYPYMPFDLGSTKGHSEFIYRAADLGLDGANKYIKRISYPYYQYTLHGDADPMTTNVTVYVANTTDNDVPDDIEGFTDVEKLTKVYEGEVTFKEGTQNAPVYATFEFDEKFLYTGNNLRVVCMHDGESFSSFNQIYFGQDADKAKEQYSLYTYDNDIRYRTGYYYPVAKFFVEDAPTVRLSTSSIDFGTVETGKSYTKTVSLTASDLLGDVIISDPTTSEVAVSPNIIAMEDAAAGNASITVTLTPSTATAGKDEVEIFTEGGETLILPITWQFDGAVEAIVFDAPKSVTVFDVLGRTLLSTEVTGNLSNALKDKLNDGIYVVKAGNEVYKLKIAK